MEDINFYQNLINKQKEIDHIVSNALLKELKNYQRKNNILFSFEEFNFKKVLFLGNIRYRLSWMFKIDLFSTNSISLKEDESNYLDQFSEILVQANNLVTKNNSRLYFVYLPKFPGIYSDGQRLQNYK